MKNQSFLGKNDTTRVKTPRGINTQRFKLYMYQLQACVVSTRRKPVGQRYCNAKSGIERFPGRGKKLFTHILPSSERCSRNNEIYNDL